MTGNDISALLRKWRTERDLSIGQLASRVNTSPATISRYENGWQRFEVYTLRKIATALNCRLAIDLIPINKNKRKYIQRLQRLFWDKEFNRTDLLIYPEWTIKRILEYGDLDDVRTVINFMGKEKFLKIVSEIRLVSKKTAGFWQKILDKEKVSCMRKYSQKKAGNFWPG